MSFFQLRKEKGILKLKNKKTEFFFFIFCLFFSTDLFAKKLYFGTVTRVVDGDTIIVEKNRIRLLNVDTEECVHPKKYKNTQFGCKTSSYVKSLLTGKRVRLECKKKRGYYKRKLCFVFLGDEMVNLKLIREGYSRYYQKYGKAGKYHKEFLKAEKQAFGD